MKTVAQQNARVEIYCVSKQSFTLNVFKNIFIKKEIPLSLFLSLLYSIFTPRPGVPSCPECVVRFGKGGVKHCCQLIGL